MSSTGQHNDPLTPRSAATSTGVNIGSCDAVVFVLMLLGGVPTTLMLSVRPCVHAGVTADVLGSCLSDTLTSQSSRHTSCQGSVTAA
ncbi:hypothetical protein TcWFU_006658 [Taenia crassiceps]|uniref:Uncharacterized protein n=1 Tax=Taenia crassiceps TaxID=6207 RepID=A0ABR4Q2F5_9CEST